MKIYRVVVRGHFSNLDEDTKSKLLVNAEAHSIFRSAFTKAGTFTYDKQLVAFNFRYEIRHSDAGQDEEAVGAEAVQRTVDTLASLGISYRGLRSTVTDMASIWGSSEQPS